MPLFLPSIWICLFFLFMSLCVPHVCWCLWRPVEDILSPGPRVRGSGELPDLVWGADLRSSGRMPLLTLSHRSSPHLNICKIFYFIFIYFPQVPFILLWLKYFVDVLVNSRKQKHRVRAESSIHHPIKPGLYKYISKSKIICESFLSWNLYSFPDLTSLWAAVLPPRVILSLLILSNIFCIIQQSYEKNWWMKSFELKFNLQRKLVYFLEFCSESLHTLIKTEGVSRIKLNSNLIHMDEKRNIHNGMPLKIGILKNYKNDRNNINVVRRNEEKKLFFLLGLDINLSFSKGLLWSPPSKHILSLLSAYTFVCLFAYLSTFIVKLLVSLNRTF